MIWNFGVMRFWGVEKYDDFFMKVCMLREKSVFLQIEKYFYQIEADIIMIEKVIIKNYKSIKNADITLRNINVLIGMNGAGKSNLISFFEMVKELYNQRLNNYVIRNGGVDRLLFNGKKYSDRIEALIDFDNRNAIQFSIAPAMGDKVFIEYFRDYFNSAYDEDKNYESWNEKEWESDVVESNLCNNTTSRAGYLRYFFYNFTIYHFHDTSMTSKMRGICAINDNEYLRSDASNLAACLYLMKEREPKNFKILEGTIRLIAPYFKCFRLSPDRLNNTNIQIEWEEVDTDAYRDAYSFSDGTMRFIALATLLLQENKPKVIIIDEPELGLHPVAIEKLVALVKMAASESQIILATQSTSLVNLFDAEDVLVANKVHGETSYKRFSEDDLKDWLTDYNMGDIWEKNLIGGRP